MDVKKIHYISGVIIAIFVGLHLFNHFVSIWGISAHVFVMDKLRIVYRNIIGETILLSAVFLQIISGIKLFLLKYKTANNNYFEKLQIWTGLYLAFFLVIHVGAVLTGRYILTLDTNFYFGVAGLNVFPFNLFFIPYYSLALISFFGHIAAIHHQKMNKIILGLTIEQQSKIIFVKGILITIVILYGLTGGFLGVEIPENYHIMIGK